MHYLLLLGTLFMLIFRLVNQDYAIVLINLSLGFFFLLSIYLCYLKKHQLALLFITHMYVITTVSVYSFKGVTSTSTILILSLLPCISLFVFEKKSLGYYYGILCTLAFYYIYWGSWSNIAAYTTLYGIAYLQCFLFNNKLRELFDSLTIANNEKEEALNLLRDRNEELVLYNNMVAHDLKSPIQNISGFVGLLNKQTDDPEHKKYIKFISDAATSSSDLISDLLTYSKVSQSIVQKTNVDLNLILEEQLTQLAPNKNQLTIETDTLPQINGDSSSIKTIFHNLLSNAIKFQPKIDSHMPHIKVSYISNPDKHDIYICDNGIGIEKEYIENLFVPFKKQHSKSKYEGSGLGMSICKKVMKKHGGDIRLESTNEKGSCFKLTFPT